MQRTLATRLRHALVTWLRPRGKQAFLRSLPPGARLLDVGCGNNSPRDAKMLRPDLHYTGLDVADYNQQDSIRFADAYVVVPADRFAETVRAQAGQMDAVVCSHNLEHCDDPAAVLGAMAAALRPGGRMFLAFPCEQSVRFPHRRGCLNFFDDPTHKTVPSWDGVVATLRGQGMSVLYACRRYRPWLLASIGLVLEPLGAMLRRNMPAGSTWALYGFETIIWAGRQQSFAPDSTQTDPAMQ
ncbi:class I SAM-dependent methyltransferase [Ramlibacter monticola]|uniref:class I SAM-dependent methyltransferase n=1 Tax=Ramlibacter monticola TaxID=1926872 RepID=UPI001F45E40F|nr:methyltransferase domain-containing protein [Ramlibacter monticola]